MNILDILNGMMNGPRGGGNPQQQQPGGGGGLSPITLALLALLAYKAYQGGMFGGGKTAPESGSPFPLPGPGETTASGGGLGDLLGQVLGGGKGGMPGTQANSGGIGDLLGGLLGGGAAGGILSGGLDQLLKQMQQGGQGKVADSWIGTGQNQEIAPKQLESVLGSDILDALMKQTGESKGSVLADLAKDLPNLVDALSPNGKAPTENDLSRIFRS